MNSAEHGVVGCRDHGGVQGDVRVDERGVARDHGGTASGQGSGEAGEVVVRAPTCRVDGVTCWGAGWDTSVLAASVHAVLAAVNRSGAQPR